MESTIKVAQSITSILSTFHYKVTDPEQRACIRQELNQDVLHAELEKIKQHIISATAKGCHVYASNKAE